MKLSREQAKQELGVVISNLKVLYNQWENESLPLNIDMLFFHAKHLKGIGEDIDMRYVISEIVTKDEDNIMRAKAEKQRARNGIISS